MLPANTTVVVQYIDGSETASVYAQSSPYCTAFRILREDAPRLSDIQELRQAGIYLLTDPKKRTFYVGQADFRENGNGLLGRMVEHHNGDSRIDEWTLGFALTSGIQHFFGATELNYLERYFHDKAQDGKYEILNSYPPHSSEVDFTKRGQLMNFANHALFLLRVQLGCDVYVEGKRASRKMKPVSNRHGTPQVMKLVSRGAEAYGIRLNDKDFLVQAGSRISPDETDGFVGTKYSQIRQDLIDQGVIADGVFTQDYTFPAISQAASVVSGQRASGIIWKES